MSKESEYFWDLMKALGIGALWLVGALGVTLGLLYGLAWLIALTGG